MSSKVVPTFTSFAKKLDPVYVNDKVFCIASFDEPLYNCLFGGLNVSVKKVIESNFNIIIRFYPYSERITILDPKLQEHANNISYVTQSQVERNERSGSIILVEGSEETPVAEATRLIIECADQLLNSDRVSIYNPFPSCKLAGEERGEIMTDDAINTNNSNQKDKSNLNEYINFEGSLGFSHFVALKVESNEITKKFCRFREAATPLLLSDTVVPSRDSPTMRPLFKGYEIPNLFMWPEALHVTLVMLKLFTDDMRERAEQALSAPSKEYLEALYHRPLKIRLRNLHFMGSHPMKSKVLYADVEDSLFADGELNTNPSSFQATSNGNNDDGVQSTANPESSNDRILRLYDLTRKRLKEQGLLTANTVSIESLLKHMTLLNTKYGMKREGNNGNWGRGNPRARLVNAERVLQMFGSYDFGSANVKGIHLYLRHAECREAKDIPLPSPRLLGAAMMSEGRNWDREKNGDDIGGRWEKKDCSPKPFKTVNKTEGCYKLQFMAPFPPLLLPKAS